MKTTIIPFTDKEGKPYQYIAIRQDITEKKEIEEQIYYKAYYDELTGLRNRRSFEEEISKWIVENTKKDTKDKTAFLFLDLNRFKYINDTLGHNTGDKILQQVSKRLLKSLQSKADLFRFGGDELQTGCKEGQGYIFSRPLPYREIELLLSKELQAILV